MEDLLERTFDFSIRIIELVKYLEEEKKHFPLKNRLLECAVGLCVSCRIADQLPDNGPERSAEACRLALEAECLLELMVKTDFLSETQSIPILTDCRSIISAVHQAVS